MAEKTCPSCGKRFTPWRGKKYCSEPCRKRAENWRLRGDESGLKGMIPDAPKPDSQGIENIDDAEPLRGDGTMAGKVHAANWIACNEITDKLQYKDTAIGWTMNIDGKGWFGRVGKEMSFGPTTRTRARLAVECYLRGEPFDKHEREKSWRGDCWPLVAGHGLKGPFPDGWRACELGG